MKTHVGLARFDGAKEEPSLVLHHHVSVEVVVGIRIVHHMKLRRIRLENRLELLEGCLKVVILWHGRSRKLFLTPAAALVLTIAVLLCQRSKTIHEVTRN